MSKKSNPAMIGAFVVGAVGLLALGVTLFGGSELFKQCVQLTVVFFYQKLADDCQHVPAVRIFLGQRRRGRGSFCFYCCFCLRRFIFLGGIH